MKQGFSILCDYFNMCKQMLDDINYFIVLKRKDW